MKTAALASLALVFAGTAFADVPKPDVPKSDVLGTWILNGSDKNTRWVFRKDGSFAFASSNATSRGKWQVEGSQIKLVWTEIDKQKVAPGKVKGAYAILPDGSFQVDRFNYRKKA